MHHAISRVACAPTRMPGRAAAVSPCRADYGPAHPSVFNTKIRHFDAAFIILTQDLSF